MIEGDDDVAACQYCSNLNWMVVVQWGWRGESESPFGRDVPGGCEMAYKDGGVTLISELN